MKSRFAPVPREGPLAGLAAALVTGCFLAAPGAMADEERSGFYLRADLSRRASRCTGRATTGRAGATSSSTRATRKSPAAPIPTGAPRRVGRLLSTRQAAFSPALRSVTGSRTGSAWRWRPSTGSRSTTRPLRWRARRATPPGSWRARAEDRIGSVSSRSVFVNLLFDLPVDGPVTPFAGLGAGVSWTELDYGDLWGRPLGAQCGPGEDRHRGGTSERGGDPEESRRDDHQQTGRTGRPPFGVPGSRRGGLGDFRRGIGRVQARYAPFEDETEWERLRSHASQLRLDGSEPVTFRIRTEEGLLRGPHLLPEPPLLIDPAIGANPDRRQPT